MKNKLTISALIFSFGLYSCAASVAVHEARDYGIHRIDRISLKNGNTYVYELDSIDDSTNRVIGRSNNHIFEYRKEEIKYFQSTKPGLTALAAAASILATIIVVFAVTWDGIHININYPD